MLLISHMHGQPAMGSCWAPHSRTFCRTLCGPDEAWQVHATVIHVTFWIKKQRHCFANKGLSSQSYGFSSGYVWMCVGGLLGVAGRLSGTVSPFRAEQGMHL